MRTKLLRNLVAAASLSFVTLAPIVAAEDLTAATSADKARDYQTAWPLYLAAAEAGDTDAMLKVANYLTFGKHVSKDPAAALKWLERMIEAGDTRGAWKIGEMYYYGDGVKADLVKSREWSCRGAELGNEDAAQKCAQLAEKGEGGPRDLALASKWFVFAAGRGLAMSQGGVERLKGNGTFVDPAPQAQLAESAPGAERSQTQTAAAGAAARQTVPAVPATPQSDTAALYAQARASYEAKDYAAAYAAYEQVVDDETDSVRKYDALLFLGYMNHHGQGRPVDYGEAAYFYRLSEELGSPDAPMYLAELFMEGKGVALSFNEAHRLFDLAGERGRKEVWRSEQQWPNPFVTFRGDWEIEWPYQKIEAAIRSGHCPEIRKYFTTDLSLGSSHPVSRVMNGDLVMQRCGDYKKDKFAGGQHYQFAAEKGYGLGLERFVDFVDSGQKLARHNKKEARAKAISELENALADGEPVAAYLLAGILVEGKWTGKDLARAADLYRYAAINGEQRAVAPLQRLKGSLESGTVEAGVQAYEAGDYDRAALILMPHAATGDVKANAVMGDITYYGRGDTVMNTIRSRNYFEAAARGGDAESARRAGEMRTEYSGGGQTYEDRLMWMENGVRAGDAESAIALARMYEEGAGVPIDELRAAAILAKAESLGSERASELRLEIEERLFVRAKMFEQGDINAAMYLWRADSKPVSLTVFGPLADAGNTEAMRYIARYYSADSRDAHYDGKIAHDMLKRAAEGGDVEAYYQYGEFLARPSNDYGDLELAVDWLTAAAEAGHTDAMIKLVELYEEGRYGWSTGTVERNKDLARYWLAQAAAAGDTSTKWRSERMEERWAEEERIAAENAARQVVGWRQQRRESLAATRAMTNSFGPITTFSMGYDSSSNKSSSSSSSSQPYGGLNPWGSEYQTQQWMDNPISYYQNTYNY
ncbi:MAG: sel1 repeat family protein [Hyphomonas sp.]|nr:sel1 repeat family protein [Hyphomonas sp.]